MRTPGSDAALALGFLYAEGILGSLGDVIDLAADRAPTGDRTGAGPNVTVVTLRVEPPGLAGLDRHFFASSACGVCGRVGVDQLLSQVARIPVGTPLEPSVLTALPRQLEAAQAVFATTGGLHAAGLFDRRGELLAAAEDVGRHNAVDKVIGWALGRDALPLADHVLVVSGRCSFEVVQKAVRAGIGVIGAVSAPTSLAVETAQALEVTLAGFLRGSRFNVYSGAHRLSAVAVTA
jgi:FdhD protein